MKVSKTMAFRRFFAFAISLIVIMTMMSPIVGATEYDTEDPEVEETVVDDDEYVITVCLAAGAVDMESVVKLEEDEPSEEDIEEVVEVVDEDDAEVLDEEASETEEEVSNAVFANVTDSVNVREEPSEESSKVGKLFKNCSGTMLEQQDGWTKIASGNLTGWVSNDYLYFGQEAEDKIAEVGTLKATVLTDALRIRKEASQDAGVYKLVKKDEKFTVTEELDGWVAVKVDSDTVGYISSEYVRVEFLTEKGKTIQEIEDEERAKEVKKLTKNRGAVASSVSETALLAALIQAEAGTQSYEGQLAVGAVVMNRVRSRGYPNTVMGVISQPGQFPPATNGTVGAIVARGAKSSCVQAAQAAINGQSNVGGALHFGRVGKAAGIVIGGHVFY